MSVKLLRLHSAQAELASEFPSYPRIALRCGRRFGKTALLERHAAKLAYFGKKVGWFSPNYKLILPTYQRLLKTLRPVITHNSKIEMILEIDTKYGDGQVEFWTLNDEDAGRSRYYDCVIIDEASLVDGLQTIWEQSIAPTLLDRRGNAIMAGTPKGVNPDNYFWAACNRKELGWKEFHRQTRENPTLDPVGVARLKDDYAPLVYQQEFLAEFVDWGGEAFFSRDSFLEDGLPVAVPEILDTIFSTIDTATKTGKEHDGTGVIYWGYSRVHHKLYVLDWDIVQIEGAMLEHWLPNVFIRMAELAKPYRVRYGITGAHIEDRGSGQILLQQAKRKGLNVSALDKKLAQLGKDERAIAASPFVYQKRVKFSPTAFDKVVNYHGVSRNHMISQVTGYRVGQGKNADPEDDLLDAFTYGVNISFSNAKLMGEI